MRIKHLLTLKQKEHKPPWMYIAIYWLAKEIYNYNKDYHHLKKNNILKSIQTVPFYYRDIIHYIKTQNKKIPNIKNETKTIYKDIILKGSKNHIINGESKWKEKIFNLDFKKIWKNTFFSYSKPKTKDLLYKILHYTIPTNSFIYKISKDKTGLTPNCDYCNKTEDNIHLFTTCDRIKKIWTYFQPYYRQLTKNNHTPQQHLLTLTSNNTNSKTKKLILTLTNTIIYEIWISRNNLKHDKIQLTQDKIITKIKTQLQNILNTHYKVNKINGTITKFKQLFCINDAIATIQNDRLQTQIT